MKRCPECRRDYHDDTLSFCLADGTELVYGLSDDEPETAILSKSPSAVSEPTTVPAISRRNALIAAVAGILLVTALGVGSYLFYGRASSKQIDSIAVMPFVNESNNPEVEYLSDGITEALIGSLSQVPNLNVKARSSVFRYKDKEATPQTIGRELNVEAILNGRVTQRGSDLSLYIELIDPSTENVLFKADYDRPMTNLLALQKEIAQDVSNKLRARLSSTEREQIGKNYTENAEAYQLYLKGRFHWNKRKPDEHLKAIAYFEQAIALDPTFALAYAGLADCYAVDSSPVKGDDRINKLRAAANRALEIDNTLGEPHAALAGVFAYDFDWAATEREYSRAIEITPNYATGHQWFGEFLTHQGRINEGLAEIDRAREIDPLSLVINSDKVYILIMARRYDDAIEQAKRTLEMEISWRMARTWLIYAYELKGMYEEALIEKERHMQYSDRSPELKALGLKRIGEEREAFRAAGPEGYWRKELEFELEDRTAKDQTFSPYYLASLYAILREKDKAFEWISKSIDEKNDAISLLKVDPAFDNVRSDPRWATQLGRMNLTP